MRTVIIVSKCLSVIKMNKGEIWYNFHFKGVCSGEALKKVILQGKDQEILKGREYVVHVRPISCEDNVLTGEIIRAKLLDECWDRSGGA